MIADLLTDDQPLVLELPNVLGSPHNSSIVPHAFLEGARQAAENVKHFLKGEKVMGIARREDYL